MVEAGNERNPIFQAVNAVSALPAKSADYPRLWAGRARAAVLHPDSGSPKYQAIEVRIGDGFDDKSSVPDRADLVENHGRLVLVPETTPDRRALLLDGFKTDEHRVSATIHRDDPDNTAVLVRCEEGAGRLGFGTAFVAIFQPDDTLVSSTEETCHWDGETMRIGPWQQLFPPSADGKRL
jgi:hypothetical protein